MKKIMIFIGGYLPGRKYGGSVTSISNFVDCLGMNMSYGLYVTTMILKKPLRIKILAKVGIELAMLRFCI